MILLDTSAVLSALFPDQNRHEECAVALAQAEFPILSPFVLAEIDYMILKRVGIELELNFLNDDENFSTEEREAEVSSMSMFSGTIPLFSVFVCDDAASDATAASSSGASSWS